MARITICNLDDRLKRCIRMRTAKHGRSMEEAAFEILPQADAAPAPSSNLAVAIRARFAAFGDGRLTTA